MIDSSCYLPDFGTAGPGVTVLTVPGSLARVAPTLDEVTLSYFYFDGSSSDGSNCSEGSEDGSE